MMNRQQADSEKPTLTPTPKAKPESHAFRVGTDDVRQAYWRERAAAMAGQLARRRELAAALAGEAAVVVPRDAGFVVLPAGRFDVADAIGVARDAVNRADLAAKKAKANKPFMVRLSEKEELTLASPLLQLGLRRGLIAAATQYLGLVPILEYANVFYSSHVDADLAKSQLYHCDSDEVEQMKLFVLCEDVTPANGPLTFLSAVDSQRVRDRVGYQFNTRLTDAQVRDASDSAPDEVALLGRAGTAALVDTSRCLHYGSRFTDGSSRRLVVMLQYVTPMAFLYPGDHRASSRFRRLAPPDADELTALVLGAA